MKAETKKILIRLANKTDTINQIEIKINNFATNLVRLSTLTLKIV